MGVVRLLGAIEVEGDRPVSIRGGRQAGLLALLCADLGRRVSKPRLEDELWDGVPVSDAALRVTVKRLRDRFVAAGVTDPIESDGGGWRLGLERDDVDLLRFEDLVERAKAEWNAGTCERAAIDASTALELWRGSPMCDLFDLPTVAIWVERAGRLRVDAAYLVGRRLLQQGDAGGCLGALETHADREDSARHREDLVELKMLAAALIGRRDLSRTFRSRLVEALRDDIGVAPGRSVEDLHEAIESHDNEVLEARLAELVEPARTGTARIGSDLPPARIERSTRTPFVGRPDVLRSIQESHDREEPVLLRAGAGMGKSRVCEEVVLLAREANAPVITAAASPLETGPEVLLLALRSCERELGIDHLESALAAGSSSADVELNRMRVRDASVRVVEALGRRPLVVIEDLHWIEVGTAQLIWHLVQNCEGVSWLLTTRSGTDSEAVRLLVSSLRARAVPGLREIALGPMSAEEVADVARQHLGGQDDEPMVRAIVERSDGWPLLAVELARHIASGGELAGVPATIADRIESVLASLSPDARSAVELLAVAYVPLESSALAPSVDRETVVFELTSTGLVRSGGASLELSHELLRDPVLAELSDTRVSELHIRAAELVARSGPGLDAVVARHLIAAGPMAAEALDRAIGPAIAGLVRAGAYDEAATLAEGLLEVGGPEAITTEGLSSRVQAASVLLVNGRVAEGSALLEAVMAPIRRLGDPVLRAEALLARGPIDVGDTSDAALVDESTEVLGLLPPAAVAQRVQLCCWLAHHQLMRAEPAPGAGTTGRASSLERDIDDLLEEAESLTADSNDPHLRGLVLGVHYQASTAVDRAVDEGRSAHDRLERWAALSGAVSADAMARLFALDRTAIEGTVAEHRCAVGALRDLIPAFPRPDVRWYVEAAAAAELLAEGRLDEAAEQVERAASLGRELRVGAAAALERVQQFVLLEARGLLAVLSPMFANTDRCDPDLAVALAGVVALAADDASRAAEMSSMLASRGNVLERSGAGWPLMAHVCSELAFRVGHRPLACALTSTIAHRRGTGASMLGLAMFGSIDRMLGLAQLASGERERGLESVRSAADTDEERGQLHWAAVALDLVNEVGEN